MMNRTEKEAVVSSIRTHIEKSQALFLTNLIGIPANDAVRIRKEVREANGHVAITKNSLFELAAKGTYAEEVLSGLKGTNAVAFAFEDAPGVAKVIHTAAGEFEDKVTVAAGMLGEQKLTKEEVVALAKLPSRDQMLATVLATFNAPVSAFVRVMDAIRTQKEEQSA